MAKSETEGFIAILLLGLFLLAWYGWGLVEELRRWWHQRRNHRRK